MLNIQKYELWIMAVKCEDYFNTRHITLVDQS